VSNIPPPPSSPGGGHAPTIPPGPLTKSEVKGVWFTTARRYILEMQGGEELLAAVSHRVDRAYRELIVDPYPSEWYPERALQQAMHAMYAILAKNDDAVFIDHMEACTTLGVNHFFRALMRMSSPAAILKKTPAMWNHIRRGAGAVEVEADEAVATIRYTEFPYFRDPNYRLLTLGAVRALVRVCGGDVRALDVVHYAWDAMTVRVTYG
jgi:hypothetical protein